MKHIVYICDNLYLIPTIVSIQSLTEHDPAGSGSEYVVHICTYEMSPEDQARLSALATDNVHIQIHDIDPGPYQDRLDQVHQNTYVTPTALLKFELPQILEDLDEVLYLDADVLVCQELDPLFDYDITDYDLAGVFDIVAYRADDKDPMAYTPSDFVFNAGVLLMNLKAMREKRTTEDLWQAKFDLFNEEAKPEDLMDQKALNAVLAKACLPLPLRYNCANKYMANEGINVPGFNHIFGSTYADPLQLMDDVVILHYIGRRSKPWLYTDCKCRQIWDSYAVRAGIHPEELQRTGEAPVSQHRLQHYASSLMRSLKTRGIVKTIRHVWYRNRLHRWEDHE